MKTVMLTFVMVAVVLFSCDKNDNSTNSNYFKAEVTNTSDSSCNKPLIRVLPSDTAAVSLISDNYTDMYVVSQLPASLNTVGQKLLIKIARFTGAEDFICNRIGFSYAHLKVVEAISGE